MRSSAQRATLPERLKTTYSHNGPVAARQTTFAWHHAPPSNAGSDEVAFGTIPLTLVAADSTGVSQEIPPRRPKTKKQEQENNQETTETHLRIGPVALAMNASAPV